MKTHEEGRMKNEETNHARGQSVGMFLPSSLFILHSHLSP